MIFKAKKQKINKLETKKYAKGLKFGWWLGVVIADLHTNFQVFKPTTN